LGNLFGEAAHQPERSAQVSELQNTPNYIELAADIALLAEPVAAARFSLP
jgi:hypothetical protein